MAQHFLLSTAARSLSLARVARMSEEEAREAFKLIRWSDRNGQPYCPECGGVELYAYRTRHVWKCKACQHQFSVTSGTIFASHKRPIRDYLLAIAIFVNGAKGHSALQLSRDLDCQYKTAFVMAHKIREALGAGQDSETVGGEGKSVEIDGMYAGGYVKPANWRENRRDRRLSENRSGKRQVVIVAREHDGKTLTFVAKTEDAGVPGLESRIALGTTVYSDEANHWNALGARYLTKQVNHQVAYSDGEACTNQAESLFSRLRRAEIGTHHHIAGPYLAAYAAEMDWREDNRRISNGEQYLLAASAVAKHGVSRQWSGYWQRAMQ
jgi:transposase-like protein